MGEDGEIEKKIENLALDLQWNNAVSTSKTITLNAADVDKLVSSIYLLQAAVFKVTEAISKRHVGDAAYIKVNAEAVDDAKNSLSFLKDAVLAIKKSIAEDIK